MAESLLRKVEVLLKAGRVNDAINVLATDPATYNRVVQGVINALASVPGGRIADLNGNIWSTSQLIELVRQGRWTAAPPLINFLMAEVELLSGR